MSQSLKTHFGLGALIVAIISDLFLIASFVITVLDISPATFFTLNNIVYLVYCVSAPLSLALGAWSFRRRNDATVLSVFAFGLVALPFLALFWQFLIALARYN
jgi:hypothetical protein